MTYGAELALGLAPDSLLGSFNRAGVLAPADVHVAGRLAQLGGERDDRVALAVALAVRAPRVGHVRVDLRRVADEVIDGAADLDGPLEQGAALPDGLAPPIELLAWPDPEAWLAAVAASALVADGEEAGTTAPLRLVGSSLYLDRYWRDERAVAADLMARAAVTHRGGEAAIGRYFGTDDGEQRWAAATAVLRGLAVIAGGPGTGKTTTVARLLALLADEAAASGAPLPLVALAAPTGKAANRMQEAVRGAAELLELRPEVRELLTGIEAATVHRLLRVRPDNANRFRHHGGNRLPHDVVIVDESSMLPLWLMARLLEAVRPDARLIFVGDPQQLASVEAGAVLGDIVGPAAAGPRMHAAVASEVAALAGVDLPVTELAPDGPSVGDSIVVLRTNHRFGGALAGLADAVRTGAADTALAALRSGGEELVWLPVDADDPGPAGLDPVRALAAGAGEAMLAAALAGDGPAAQEALGSWRILCAHRSGPAGAATWNSRVEGWLSSAIEGLSTDGEWYCGRPVIVTANDYGLRLFNGDTGVVVARPAGGVEVAFAQGPVSPSRLSGVDTVYAMTVHKAQGSEFERVAVVLPRPTSRLLTRELLYTAVTRARSHLVIVGSEESVRTALARPIARASGLTERLWGSAATPG